MQTTLFTAYEYGDDEGSEPDSESVREGVANEADDDASDVATSDEESTGGQTDEDEDGVTRDWSDDDDPSW